MSSSHPRKFLALTVAGLLAAAGMCSCAGHRAAKESDEPSSVAAKTRNARSVPKVNSDAADDLRQFIDQTDPITEMDRRALDDPKDPFDLPTNIPRRVDDQSTIDGPPSSPPSVGPSSPQALTELGAKESPPILPAGVEPAGPPAPNDPPESPESRLAKQVAALRATIGDLRTGGDSASAEALELLALSLLNADGAQTDLDAVKDKLSAGQRRSLSTLQGLLEQVRDGDGVVTALDARRLSRLLTEYGDKLADERPLKIIATALCTSVQSYGSYTKFPDNTFLQGRAQPVIVYVALENFSQRPAAAATARADDALREASFNAPSAKEREKKASARKKPKPEPAAPPAGSDFVVELTESIAIHDDSDDIVVWKAPEASIRDVARDKRKDYYLVQRVELPARLTLGRYNLKVSVHDAASGATDEAVIPFDVVADPSLISAR